MGDLRDQLKKIKAALDLPSRGQSGVDASKEPAALKNVTVTVKKQRASHSVAPAKVSPKTKRPEKSLSRRPASRTKKQPATIPKAPVVTGKADAPDSIIVTRKVAPSVSLPVKPTAVAKPAPALVQQLVLPSFSALTRTSEFKMPDAWVKRGASSQYNSGAQTRRRDVYIGLDFGTAFTKAAVQVTDNIYPVDWGGVANLPEKFLLPTEYSEGPAGECFLGQHPNASLDGLHTNLKRSFIIQRVSDVAMAKACVFIGLVLQYVRAWIYHHHGVKLGSMSVGWYLNMGIPSDVLDKDQHASQYKKLARIAWALSLLPRAEIRFDRAFELLGQSLQSQPDLREVGAVPELVAQLAGYSKSSSRLSGLHTLIDIGGGTVDMVTFNVHQADGDDVFPFFVAQVKPLGSYALLEHRFSKLPTKISDIAVPTHELLNDQAFARATGSTLQLVREADKQFFRLFQQEFEAVLGTTYRRRYPSSPNWHTGIRTFISGGGASIPGYAAAIRNSRRPVKCPLAMMELPPHPRLAGVGTGVKDYSRISVACGLAVDELSLGSIRPASQVEDAGPLITTVNGLPLRERLDRDELYPK